mmetsp:Transcript_26883/g.92451  ORF Transcript_26883/g.92451 Transcript_26883/m.92451 type:complete len:201 (-) Transcript_26883:324-926(-)
MLPSPAARATGLVRPAVRAAPWSPPVAAPAPALARAFRAGARCLGLEEFYDARHRGRIPENPVAGRAWNASEIRRKSFDDIHKLWYVLYKERCCLLTEKMRARRHNMLLKGPMRHGTVRKSMAMIRVVLAERRAAYRLMIGKKKGSPRDFQYGVKAVGNSGKKVHWYKDKAVAKEETALASREARALAASKLEDELLEPL